MLGVSYFEQITLFIQVYPFQLVEDFVHSIHKGAERTSRLMNFVQ